MTIRNEATSGTGCVTRFSGICWTAFSSIFVVIGLWQVWEGIKSRSWDKVPCTIERFEIVEGEKDGDDAFRADLVFRYEIGGKSYTGDRLWPDEKGSDSYEKIAEIREPLLQGPEGRRDSPAGALTECRVNSANPVEATLRGGSKGQILFGIAFATFGGFFVLIGLLMIFGKITKPAASSPREEVSPILPVGFSLIFGLAGLGILGGEVVPKFIEWRDMHGWKETPAEILHSRVRSESDSDGTTYAVELLYRYQVNGREYRSNRYSLIGGSSSGYKGKAAIVEAHPPGTKLTVFVDPDQPWRAVVKRNIGWWGLFALLPLLFMAIGIGGLWWFFKGRHRKRAVSNPGGNRQPAPKALTEGPPLVAGEWQRTRVGTGCGFVAILFFTLFWNTIVGVGLSEFLPRPGSPGSLVSMFFVLFLVPFVLIGLCLVGVSIYVFFSLFGPVYEVRLEKSPLHPGDSARLQWRRAKGAGTLRKFELILVGREEATYANGSSSSTTTSVFHEESLFDTTIALAMTQGQVEVRIPRDAVPTFKGKHNRIRWFICLRGDVARLPDLRDDQEILVLPPPAQSPS